jgi:hypothetical protein
VFGTNRWCDFPRNSNSSFRLQQSSFIKSPKIIAIASYSLIIKLFPHVYRFSIFNVTQIHQNWWLHKAWHNMTHISYIFIIRDNKVYRYRGFSPSAAIHEVDFNWKYFIKVLSFSIYSLFQSPLWIKLFLIFLFIIFYVQEH